VFELGSNLRDARVRRKLELSQVEAETHIRAKYLAALEDERFELLPHPAYARTFLRTYAAHLGLDPRLYLDEYDSRFPPDVETTIAPARAAARPRRTGRWLLLVPAAAIAGVIVWQVATSGGGGGGGATLRPRPARTHTRAEVRPAAAPGPVERSKRRPRTVRLRLVARERSWIEVRRGSAQGPVVLQRTLEPGQAVRLRGSRLWLRLGSPWNLEATLGGKRLPLPSGVGNVVVTPTGLRAGA
jgi:helix-turn-helix protein/uncharacterized protein DUF4115